MDNYEIFKEFLDSSEIHYNEDSFDNGDRFFAIPQKIKSGPLLNVIVIFSRIRIKILILGISSLEDEDKRSALYDFFNEFNRDTSFFKMYLRGDEICVEGDFSTDIINGDFEPEEFMNFILAALMAVDRNYRNILKILLF